MTDQNLPEENYPDQKIQETTGMNDTLQQENVLPSQEENIVSEQTPSFSEATSLPVETIPQGGGDYSPQVFTPTPPPPPTIVVPAGGNNVPKLFYLIFGLTLIVFFAVTGLLVKSLLQKPASSPEPTPSAALTPVVPSSFPTVTPLKIDLTLPPVFEATDQAVLKLRKKSSSDEFTDLEEDINNTDLSSIKEGIDALDKEMGINSE